MARDPDGEWRPLSGRHISTTPAESFYEGVPPHLDLMLRGWIAGALFGGGAQLVALRLRMPLRHEDIPDVPDAETLNTYLAATLAETPNTDLELLDIVDAILSLGGPWPRHDPEDPSGEDQNQAIYGWRDHLDQILDVGGSVYMVHVSGRFLVRRVSATSAFGLNAASAAAQANPDSGSASAQLNSAWNAIHSLHPDPTKAFSEAIKAVESAAHAVIEPYNPKATLGTMLRQLRANPARYKLAIQGPEGAGNIAALIGMLELLWRGQTSRHGGRNPARPESRRAAEMAVQLAITLVHWFTTGAVHTVLGPAAPDEVLKARERDLEGQAP